MGETAYTIHDSPAVVARIQGDLALIESAVRESDPALRSLVLTGGFARGEGSVLDGVPQNDYDLVALRGLGRPRVPYARLRTDLEARIGLHVDLAPVGAWRISWVKPSIFWYETALRGRVLWGENLLGRIPVRTAGAIQRTEGLRLLVNRAAGLLLVRDDGDAHALRLQASKAFLAVADAHLLARKDFAPSQKERWERLESLRMEGKAPANVEELAPWLEWAYRFKVDPGAAPQRDAEKAWKTAAKAILATVPVALRHAGLRTLDAYARRDGLLDHLVYFQRSRKVAGARRWVLHPAGRVRVATLRMLEASLDGELRPETSRRWLGDLARNGGPPLRLLQALRQATLQ